MTDGVALVRAHLDSFVAGRVQDFVSQLAPTFRYRFLPPVLGEGPVEARRWSNILFSIYRDWAYVVENANGVGEEVSMKVAFVGLDPIEPGNTIGYFYDTCLFEWSVKGERLTGCNALYLPFEAHEMLPHDEGRRSA